MSAELIEGFVRALWQPGDVRELRIPRHDGRSTASGYFDDPLALAAAAAPFDGHANVYVSLNPVVPALLARAANRVERRADKTTADADILERRWLLVDIDPKRPAGISATDAESEAALTAARAIASSLAGQGWPLPMTAMTGNGYALLYPVSLPNDRASNDLVNGVLRHLAERFDNDAVTIDTTVSNAARIAALVGTLKVKGDSTADRPHRRSRLIWTPDELAPVLSAQLEALVPVTNGRHPPTATASLSPGWVRELLDGAHVSYREQSPDAAGIVWYGLENCPAHPDDGVPWQCGVGEAPGGRANGKCFHNRGQGWDWQRFKSALGLAPPITIRTAPDGADIHSSGPAVPSGRKQLPFITARRFAAESPEDVPWIARPWVARGAITELDGRPKAAGKTTWLAHLIRAALDGAPFLGERVTRTPVVLLTEQAPSSFRPMLARAGLVDRDDLHLLFWRDTRGVGWPGVVDAAAERCRETGAGLLIIDTLPQFAGMTGDTENDAGAALEAMGPLQAVAADGMGVIVSRHDRKGGGEVGESGRGSSAFAGAVDVILALRRGDGESRPTIRHLHALSRFDETPDELVIELTDAGYVALGSAVNFAVEEAKAAVLATVGEDPQTAAEIVTATALKRTAVYAALAELTDSGQVVRDGTGKRNDGYRFSIASDRPEPIRQSLIGPDESNEGNDPLALDLVADARTIFSDMLAPSAEPTNTEAMVPRPRPDA